RRRRAARRLRRRRDVGWAAPPRRHRRRLRRSPDGDGVRHCGAGRRRTVDDRGRRGGGHLLSGILRNARQPGAVRADKVYLVGFMAAGKTTLARALAKRLDWQAIDIDELIEQRERQSVAEIFARRGEAYFRVIERQALAEQLPPRHLVVATGG